MGQFELLREQHQQMPSIIRTFNGLLNKAKLPIHLTPNMRRQGIMVTTEQRANMSLLFQHVLDEEVLGDIAELGCYEGQTSEVLAVVMNDAKSYKRLHLFDNFMSVYGSKIDVRSELEARFTLQNLPTPVIHAGDFKDTLNEVPSSLCFVHIDCGNGDNSADHSERIVSCLSAVYPRMSSGAIGVMMDYHDQFLTIDGWDSNPGVKLGCDRFFEGKSEALRPMYGGEFSHGYFRKH